jgi:hypothetical protein
MFQRNGPSAGAEEAERLDLEKHARLEAGLIDPVSAIQPAPTAEHRPDAVMVLRLAGGPPDALRSFAGRRVSFNG